MKLSAPSFSKVKFVDKLMFTKHLAVMTKSGIPIAESLQLLAEQSESKFFQKILTKILHDIENGASMTESMEKFPKVFDHFYISMIRTGEESGTLDETLVFLSSQLTKEMDLRKKIQGAMLYPTLVFSTITIMGGFIALFILPKLVDFFEAFDTELPFTTKVLLFVSNNMKDYGVFIIGGIVLTFFIISALLKSKPIKPFWHRIMLKLPIFGKLIVYSQTARFTRNLGILLKSGVPAIRSLETTTKTMSNIAFANDLKIITGSLDKGENIGKAIESHNFHEFPPIVSKMISVGEKTGNLDDSLIYLSEFYEEEIDNVSKNLSTILEPLMLIIIGLVVGFVALAIISPIYELTGSIR